MTEKIVSKYLLNLEQHLAEENPVLLDAAKEFQKLNTIAYNLGFRQRAMTVFKVDDQHAR